MNEKAKERLIEDIVNLASNAVDPSAKGDRRTRIISSEGRTFALTDDFVDLCDAVRTRLLKDHGWSEKFSERYLDNLLHKLLADLIEGGNSAGASRALDDLISEFRSYTREHVVYIPLVGIEMSADTLEIGNVVLTKMTEDRLSQLTQDLESAVHSTTSPADVKERVIEVQRTEVLDPLQGTVSAEARFLAEPARAMERAKEETRRAMDLLWYAVPALYTQPLRVAVGLQGEVLGSRRWIPVQSQAPPSFNLHLETVGALAPFQLSQENLEHMDRIGVFTVSKVLQKRASQLTEFERTVLRGIHWFANSQIQVEKENELLSLITCLETYLTPRDASPVQTAIAEGVSIVLEAGVPKRRHLKKRIKEFYAMRSAISHGGRKAILESDLAELRLIAGGLTMRMIERIGAFTAQQDLLHWLEGEKFG